MAESALNLDGAMRHGVLICGGRRSGSAGSGEAEEHGRQFLRIVPEQVRLADKITDDDRDLVGQRFETLVHHRFDRHAGADRGFDRAVVVDEHEVDRFAGPRYLIISRM